MKNTKLLTWVIVGFCVIALVGFISVFVLPRLIKPSIPWDKMDELKLKEMSYKPIRLTRFLNATTQEAWKSALVVLNEQGYVPSEETPVTAPELIALGAAMRVVAFRSDGMQLVFEIRESAKGRSEVEVSAGDGYVVPTVLS